ncbi:hypothetical protein [Streptomyces liangshanensis]|uniref:Uncharacterized protein n=1 Tax=Streptomyces liangshanensis TaxID=2717324 RepID=A0A6G9GXE7_9ACTN|nr:hypothetical protein [Streptomyces liangshanensis]QIQ02952.1 hypothetical protein HA039_11965 [Streptomyces liangshanensis]
MDRFALRHVFLNAPEPSWLGEMHDGRVVDLAAGLRLLRGGPAARHEPGPAGERGRAAVGGAPTLVLERWAHGAYGHRWYLVEDGGLLPVAGSVRRQSLVTAFLGVETRWAARSALPRAVESTSADDDQRVVVFVRSGGVALRTVVCGEGIPLPGEDELPPGDEFGVFGWPEEGDAGVAFLQGVVPGADGELVARWSDPWVR